MIADCTDEESAVPFATSWFLKWRKVLFWTVFAVALALFGYRCSLGERVLSPSLAHAADESPLPSGVASPKGRGASSIEQGGSAPSNRPGVDLRRSGTDATRNPEVEKGALELTEPQREPGAKKTPNDSDDENNAKAGETRAPGETPGAEQHGITADGRVLLNLATAAELCKLPGIGKSRARAIVAYRTRIGQFRRIEELLRVKGIGRRRLNQLRPKILLEIQQEQNTKK